LTKVPEILFSRNISFLVAGKYDHFREIFAKEEIGKFQTFNGKSSIYEFRIFMTM